MFSTSHIEISKSALENNLDFIRNLIGADIRISSVVKGNAYGHGIERFTMIAEECGIDHFSVYSADEALRVLNSVIDKPEIMIMGMIDKEELEWAIENEIQFFVFEFNRLNNAIDIAKKVGKPAIVHVEVETGLNRTGFTKNELEEVADLLKANQEYIRFKGLCTHYAGAESIANYLRIKKQITNYRKACRWLQKKKISPELLHTACSAAVIAYPKTRMDLVRIGILQYGYWPGKETLIEYLRDGNGERRDPLKRVIAWKSKIMVLKEIPAGEFIGYGNHYLAHENMHVAIVPVGYSHGYSRALSNQGRVLIKGHRQMVVGIVNMNALIVDVTNIPVEVGDEVVLIGDQGDVQISVASFGEMSNQLNYELLTRLPNDIPRIVVE